VRTVVQLVDEHAAEVIVVGIWNESPLRGLLLGSVAHKLLQLSDRPVLAVPGR
jgi:nucleotide-binding universal stress UspA family protein